MLFLTHLLFGVLVALVVKGFIPENYLIFFFLVLLGSVLPDIDVKGSKVNKWGGFVGSIISFFSRHRGFFHSLGFVVMVVLLVKLFLGEVYAWGLFLGLVGHLFLDSMSRKGVRFFYPFSDLELKGWVKVGGWEETMIRVLLVGLIVWSAI
jgi:inner membrane protein